MYAELIDSSIEPGPEGVVADVGYLVAAFCVMFYAYQRFNTPALLRYTTTLGQYWMALIGYVTASFFLFSLMTGVLKTNPEIGKLFIAMAPGTVTDQQALLPAPFVAALFMTIFLPKFPGLKSLDASVQDFFRKMGEIPHQALRLGWRMQRNPLQIPERRKGAVARRLVNLGLNPTVFFEAEPESTEAKWAKIVALKVEIEDYAGAHPGFKLVQPEEIERLDQAYARQGDMASVVYKVERPDPALKRAFRSDCRALLKDMSEVIARGLFQTHRNLHSVLGQLSEWGFDDIHKDFKRLTLNQIAGVVLGIAAYLLVFFLIFGTSTGTGVPGKLKMAVTIGVIMGAAIVCATLPKSVFYRGAKSGENGQSQFLFYIFASLCAGVLWFGIHAARLYIEGVTDFAAIQSEIWPTRQWILMPMTTAFFTAWLTDDVIGRCGVRKAYQRWLEGAAMGLALCSAMFLVQYWRIEEAGAGFAIAAVAHFLFAAAVIGFLIGFFVPALNRQIPEETRRFLEEQEAAHRDDYEEPALHDPDTDGTGQGCVEIRHEPGWIKGQTQQRLTFGALGLLVTTWEIGRHFASKARDFVS